MLTGFLHSMSMETQLFIAVIALFTVVFHIRYSAAVVHKAPAILTTLGILGTFVGIAVGLLHFNANDVQNSVPSLLDGIKTAVWASACGIACALSIKMRELFFGVRKKITAKGASGSTVDDLAALLTSIQQTLGGSHETSVVTQMQLARQDTADRLDRLVRALEGFCEKMIDNDSTVMLEALKKLVGDFNTKMEEQFGGNLKQLSQEIHASNEEHKTTMNNTIKNYNEVFDDNVRESIEATEARLANLEASFGEQLNQSLEHHKKEFASLTQGLSRFVRQMHNDSVQSIK